MRPNVLLILVDDMGYSDIGCFGGEIATPNLDRLARGGLRMSSMYNCARCCPSRAALLTGLYPHQAGVGHMVGNYGTRAYQGYLSDDCVTLAEVLRPAGYFTGYSGKWHVGGTWPRSDGDGARWRFDDPTHPTPISRGFDRFSGNAAGGGSYYNLFLVEQEKVVDLPDNFYTTDHYTTRAIDFMAEARAQDKPFFVHLCYNAPHWPLHALPEDIAKYRGRYSSGWDPIRTSRHEKLKGLGILNKQWEIAPRDGKSPGWSGVALKDWEDARMATYAAMVDRMDQNVGRILTHLESTGQLDNTLIIFVSDNGGCAEVLGAGPRKMEIQSTRDGRPVRFGNHTDLQPGGPDTFMSYDLPWANASNSPFRRFKSWVHEGGISTPVVAHWPAAIKPGALRHEAAHFIDLTATIYDVAGAAYPSEFKGKKVQPLEGESLRPLLTGKPWERHSPVFWEHQGNRAMRLGDLKLVSSHPGEWELYNMADDRTELRDLTGRYPQQRDYMARRWDQWADRCGVLPWPVKR
jgi:arylsulfatase